jgi:hypothetical protein
MPIAAKVNSFQSKVSGDQGFLAGRKLQYSAIVANAGQDVIPSARLPANPGDQSFFKERQSVANIDDKTILPKPATLVVFSSEQPPQAAGSSTYSLSAAHPLGFLMPAAAASTARVGLIGAVSGSHQR